MPRSPEIAFADALGHGMADKRLEILRRVAQAGSISQAARDAGVSYKAAWQALDTLANLTGAVLVEKAVGGSGGGGARVTAAGRQLIRAADAMARARNGVLADLARGGSAAPRGVAALALRTSMRNQLPCAVTGMRLQAGAMVVTLQLAGGALLRSRITRESAQLLGLAKGLQVLALCKATAVRLMAQPNADDMDANVLPGVVSRAPPGAGGEGAMTLEGGLQLVGFAPATSGLRLRRPACAAIDASAVVIALA